MKVLITGSRGWTNEAIIFEALKELPDGCEFIIGDAAGADAIAADIITKQYGKDRKWKLYNDKVFEAKWNKYGSAAGPIRNYEMLEHYPDLVRAFRLHHSFTSPGTDHMIKLAIEYFFTIGCRPVGTGRETHYFYPTGHELAGKTALKIYVSS